MTTPVHLSGPRPSTASSTPSNSSAQSASQSTNGGGAQAAMFDLLFALQMGAGGWENHPEGDPALSGEDGETLPPPDFVATAADPAATTAAVSADPAPVTDPAALLWNPFSERIATADATPVADTADTTAAIASTDESGKGRGPRAGAMPAARPDAAALQTLNAEGDKMPAAHAEGAPREYSQVQSEANRDARSPVPSGSVQAQPANPTTAPAAPVVSSLDAPLGTPAFREQLASQIAVFIDQKQLSAQIQVHPPELGPVDVEIKIKADAVDVGFFATQADARDALELAIPQLKEMLAGQGLSLGSAHVGTRDDSRAFADTLPGGHAGGGERRDAPSGSDRDGSRATSELTPITVRRSMRLVDTFA